MHGYFDTDRWSYLRKISLTHCIVFVTQLPTAAICRLRMRTNEYIPFHFDGSRCSRQSLRHVKTRSMFSQRFSSLEFDCFYRSRIKLNRNSGVVHVFVWCMCAGREGKKGSVFTLKSKWCKKKRVYIYSIFCHCN